MTDSQRALLARAVHDGRVSCRGMSDQELNDANDLVAAGMFTRQMVADSICVGFYPAPQTPNRPEP